MGYSAKTMGIIIYGVFYKMSLRGGLWGGRWGIVGYYIMGYNKVKPHVVSVGYLLAF